MINPRRIKSKALKRCWVRGDTSKLPSDRVRRVQRILAGLNGIVSPEELDLPGYGWHVLGGNRKGTFSVKVSANWRITFRWDEDGPYDVDLEDYHGD